MDTSSPTFVAEFADGEITRMTTHTPLDKLDVGRGARLARHAYRQRTGQTPPGLQRARFENEDGVMQSYTATELDQV